MGYVFKKKGRLVFEEEDLDWEKTIEPILEVYKRGEPRLKDFYVLNLINTVQIQSLFLKLQAIGTYSDPTFRAKWASMSAYNIATLYTPLLAQKFGSEFYDSIQASCPAVCNVDC